ncbi:beta-propeller domain-containing protein [Psychrobium sp. MM17-31]|uniref:beta-propeller domain-containing protein n=1 Tax=Psychrobium sp. MM17-31 TaxID=2917758 RepID=UPI001EF60392|nr:beta-propeller domain-containing protein [Psychrobium sp. MM17-31]MCG7529969.1 beta-propeller domain-containing protein [Psychrobium sp. MM17-31]
MNLSLVASSIIATAFAISGCGGGSSSTQPTPNPTPNPTPQPTTTLPERSEQPLVFGALSQQGESSLGKRLRNGVYLAHTSPINNLFTVQANETADSNHSKAITQEAGVDESDRFHYNGQQLFLTINNKFNYGSEASESSDMLRILQRQSDNSLTKLSDTPIVVDDEQQFIDGMYVNGDNVSVFSTAANNNWPIMFDIFYPSQHEFSLSIFDTSNHTAPNLKQQFTFDGYVLSSRQIENKLYVVSSFSASIDTVIDSSVMAQDNEAIYKALNNAPLSEFLPHVTDIDGNKTSLVPNNECFVPQNFDENSGHHGLVLLSVIDTNNPTNVKSRCINTTANGIYVSKDAVYLYGEQYHQDVTSLESVIYKFAITDDSVEYRAYATLDGNFGWRNSQFRFNEQGDYLTTISTTYDKDYTPTHQLSVFKDDGSKVLKAVGHLPNQTHSTAIGKPNEDIYAVRYFNDKAYIVTFERIDPLYVIDLKNPEEPVIEGTLEIPGYSAYLHPIDEQLLLGVGQHVILRDDDDGDLPTVDQGAQVSLFDVSEPKSPAQLGNQVYKDSFTPVEFDHHALSYLKLANDSHRVAIPVESWSTTTQSSSFLTSTLQLLEVTGIGSDATLSNVGQVTLKKDISASYFSSIDARSILIEDGVYYIHGNDVVYRDWQQGSDTLGPFAKD